jgi:uncharacterized protein (DUF1800 family)
MDDTLETAAAATATSASTATPAPHAAHDTAPGERWSGAVAAASAAALLAACGGGGGGGDSALGTQVVGAPATQAGAARLLAQATPGAPREAIDEVMFLGYAGWIDEQFDKPRSTGHFDWMMANGFGVDANRDNTAGLDNSIWRKLITSGDPLRQRVTLALSELLVVSVTGVETNFRQFAVARYLDILEANAFGNYRQLLQQVTLSTAMGYYLTYRGNAKANGRGSQPDENYARELMQLFTIGLVQLNDDGTVQPGAPETYDQADVAGLARVFTGWDLDTSGLTSPFPPEVHRRPMVQVGTRYETGAKTFLGTTIAAGTPALAALNTALDTLFRHPNLPPFVGKQLIQRLVTSNPSPGYVARVAAVFRNNGGGVRGDLRAVVRAILLDPEARDGAMASVPTYGKLREPVVRFLNWARAFDAASPSGLWAIGDLSDAASRLGQSPMRSPSVFNFFRPGYVPPTSAAAAAGLVGPEFQLTNESTVAGYLNFMQSAIQGNSVGDVRANYAGLMAMANDPGRLLDELNLVLAANQLSDATVDALRTALATINASTDAGRRNRVLAALLLVLAAPEYLVQK